MRADIVIMKNPVHPGEILKVEFLDEIGLTVEECAVAIGVPSSRVGLIVSQQVALSADIAMRFSRLFGTTPEFWLNMQRSFELSVAAADQSLSRDLALIERHTTTIS